MMSLAAIALILSPLRANRIRNRNIWEVLGCDYFPFGFELVLDSGRESLEESGDVAQVYGA